jgi:predicted histone-like DNA-binding protein
MAVKYVVVARGNPQDRDAPPKYYPRVKSTGKANIQDVAERAADMSTFSPIDLAAAVETFLNVLPKELAVGRTVELGDFGTFSVRVRSVGSDTEGEVTSRNITRTVLAFRPGKRIKKIIDQIEYEPY